MGGTGTKERGELLSKAARLSGGYVAATRGWIDLLTNRARSFIYSTAPPPALAHAALTSLDLIRSEEGEKLRQRLQKNIACIRQSPTPILPVIPGSNEAAPAASVAFADAGFHVPVIRFPTVPRGTARQRISLSASHPREAVSALASTVIPKSWN